MRRKTRKEKEATQRRYALQREKKQKIAKLKSEIIDCKELIKQGRIKNLKIYASRTIKTIGSFTLATLPFSLALALCSGLFCLGGVGVPFRMDSFKNYNCIQGSMDSNGNYSIVSEYDSSSKSEYFDADVFYPWEKKEDTYQRLVYKYDFDTSDSKLLNEIQKYIESCDYQSISKIAEASKTFYEVVENDLITNDELSQGYYIKSEFYYKDSDDYTMYTEKVSDNVLITTVSLGVSAFCEILAIIMLEGTPIEIVHDSATYGNITEIAELKGNLKNKEQELEELEGVKSNGRKKR